MALGPVNRGKALLLQESGEEALDEIFGRRGVVPSAADERIKRIPVPAAQRGERARGLGLGRVARGDHLTPMRGRKLGVGGLGCREIDHRDIRQDRKQAID